MKPFEKAKIELDAFENLYSENYNDDYTDNTQLLCMKFFKAGIKVNEKTILKDLACGIEIVNKQIGQLAELRKQIEKIKAFNDDVQSGLITNAKYLMCHIMRLLEESP